MTQRRTAITALTAAGLLWGLTVPLSKLSMGWLGPAWLTVVRFTIAGALLACVNRRDLRAALTPRVAVAGAAGFGAVILLQNAGIERTSVSHAAVLLGTAPMFVALATAVARRRLPSARAAAGYRLALAGIALVAGHGGAGATVAGDSLVLVSAAVSALLIVCQPRLLAGRDPVAVTAVQFAAAAVVALPVALTTRAVDLAGAHPGPVLAVTGLSVVGTLLLFAFGQSRVPAELAGAFVNLEPVVGAALGWLAFGNRLGPMQAAGAVAVLGGIALSARRSLAAPAGGGPARASAVAQSRLRCIRHTPGTSKVSPPWRRRSSPRSAALPLSWTGSSSSAARPAKCRAAGSAYAGGDSCDRH
jgi:drug/metabolite transporter (DMT)-like permease